MTRPSDDEGDDFERAAAAAEAEREARAGPQRRKPQLEAALALAGAGVPMFPCRPDTKAPLTGSGFKDATVDVEQVARWWRRWPDALIGIPCGAVSGLWVCDLDVDKATGEHVGEVAITYLGISPPPYVITTRSGGVHWIYRYREGLPGNTAKRLAGIDSRGDGGYVIAWDPEALLDALHDPETPEPPEALLAALTKPASPLNGAPYTYRPGNAVARAETALEREASEVAHTAQGGRNHRLNVASFALGQIAAAGHLEHGRVEAELMAAAATCGLPPAEAERTIASGMTAGEAEPRGPRADDGSRPKARGIGAAPGPGPAEPTGCGVNRDDFVALMTTRTYVFIPTRDHWGASAVNARVPTVDTGGDKPVLASAWIDQHHPVEQATWSPGEPMLIRDRLVTEGGWIPRPGCTVLNLYRPPTLVPRAGDPSPWLDLLYRVYPDTADHILKWLAMRVQRPDIKVNHAPVLGGAPGIGKDTILEPVKRAVGQWNVHEVSPQQVLGRFNGFWKAVIVCISETRDLGEFDRSNFYEHLKTPIAAPPMVLRIDEKNLREYYIPNLCGVILTTNHKTDGFYLEAGDRRHHVSWSDLTKADFTEAYWNSIWNWFDAGGAEIVAGYLHSLDLRGFNPKAPPPKTDSFWEIVAANQAPENSEMKDALERCGWPDAVTIGQIKAVALSDFGDWLADRKNARRIPHRLEECGYLAVRNPDAEDDGRWRVLGSRQMIYATKNLSAERRLRAARDLADGRA